MFHINFASVQLTPKVLGMPNPPTGRGEDREALNDHKWFSW